MKRVHERIRSSGEMVFLDSSGGMEEYNLRVFLMVTHSFSGALPLGIIVTSDETTDTLTKALEMFVSLLPDYAFHGKGVVGPDVIMTDNCDELKDALHDVWPKSNLLLCVFHLMQQVWRWLFDKNHGILNQDRPSIINQFKKVVYANSVKECEDAFSNIIDLYGEKYPKLKLYLSNVFEIKERCCKERQLCSYIAIGAILPDSLYEGLHDYVRDKHDEFIYLRVGGCFIGISACTVQTSNTENIQQELAEAFKIMSILVDKHYNNADFLKGVLKFCTRLKMNENRISNLTSSLHCFGIDSYQSKRITNTTLRKKRNGVKIKVQPEAV
ncbi:uncharacterized protein LOC124806224 [Hydra vulgaris]|uniref:uncharacterized protein LOC124806224 n=1 Tax=Hydra vulgaris TaxID=6087 RepID=UPI0032E9C9E6